MKRNQRRCRACRDRVRVGRRKQFYYREMDERALLARLEKIRAMQKARRCFREVVKYNDDLASYE